MNTRPFSAASVSALLALALLTTCGTTMAQEQTLPENAQQLVQPGEGCCLVSELIYPLDNKPTPECHASTIVETPSGMVVK